MDPFRKVKSQKSNPQLTSFGPDGAQSFADYIVQQLFDN